MYGDKGAYDKGNINFAYDKAMEEDEEALYPEYEYEYVDYPNSASTRYSSSVNGGQVYRRSDQAKEEEEEEEGYAKDWRYVLGLPPWFMKSNSK